MKEGGRCGGMDEVGLKYTQFEEAEWELNPHTRGRPLPAQLREQRFRSPTRSKPTPTCICVRHLGDDGRREKRIGPRPVEGE